MMSEVNPIHLYKIISERLCSIQQSNNLKSIALCLSCYNSVQALIKEIVINQDTYQKPWIEPKKVINPTKRFEHTHEIFITEKKDFPSTARTTPPIRLSLLSRRVSTSMGTQRSSQGCENSQDQVAHTSRPTISPLNITLPQYGSSPTYSEKKAEHIYTGSPFIHKSSSRAIEMQSRQQMKTKG